MIISLMPTKRGLKLRVQLKLNKGNDTEVTETSTSIRLNQKVKTSIYKGEKYRAHQQQLINEGELNDVIEMHINDIRSKFGNKYDKALE